MAFDVIIGRSKADVEKFGLKGTILMGKQYVKMGQTTSLSNPVYMDVAGAHVVFIVGKRGCLSGDTKILTENSFKKIKDFNSKKDKVYSFNGKSFELEPAELLEYDVNEELVQIECTNGQKLLMTKEHPLLTEINKKRKWKEAKSLKEGDKLVSIAELRREDLINKSINLKSKLSYCIIKNALTTRKKQKVYDLTVPKNHSFIANGVISHNSGKSYTLGAIAEGLSDLPLEIKQNLSIVLIDTMGIYWTMKYPNFQDAELAKQWGFSPKGLDVKIYTPTGFFYKFKEEGIPADFPFSIRPLDVGPEDWCNAFELSPNSAEGVLIAKVVQGLNSTGKSYSMNELVEKVRTDEESDKVIKSIIVNQFLKAQEWGIFAIEGTPLKDMIAGGQVTVLDISPYATVASGWGIKALVVGLLCRTLFNQRMLARKTEEFKTVDSAMHYFSKDVEEKMEEPLAWIALDECLPYSSIIQTNYGEMKIGKIVEQFKSLKQLMAWGYDPEIKQFGYFPITKVYQKRVRELLELKTETGRKLICTPDHKVLTKDGFTESEQAANIGAPPLFNYSKQKKHIIARLIGHLYGDGWLSANSKQAGFSGKKDIDDLEKIRADIEAIGFSSSKVYSRKTASIITSIRGKEAIVNGTSHSVAASASVFNFFSKLEVPIGSKTNNDVLVPRWLMNAPKPEKAEFLAALLGADGVAPSQSNKWGGDFNPIRFSFNKAETLRTNGKRYAKQIKQLLNDLGIKVSQIKEREGNIRVDKTNSIKFVITLAKNVENTIRFLEKVGYRYCTEKELKGNKWLCYLKARQSLLKEREKLRLRALKIRKEKKWGKIKIAKELGIPDYQVREWIYYGRGTSLPWSFKNFNVWMNSRSKDNLLYEKIISKTKKSPERVYDISVEKIHNFIANGFIVHNCHEFLPKEGKTAATEALVTILREGRQPGISLILASQQPGKVHTDVMTQSDIVISHRLTAQMDVQALGQLMQSYMRSGLDQELNMLPHVKGAAVVFDDSNERMFPVQMRPRFTWHGGSSPTAIKERKSFFSDALKKIKEM